MARDRMGALRRRCAIIVHCAMLLLCLGLSARQPAFASEKAEPETSGNFLLLKEKPFDSSGGTGLLPDQMVRLLQYYLLNPSTCQGASGSWAVNTPPVNGAVSTGIFTKMASGGYCPGDYFPYAAIYYTWTGSTNGQYTDSFTATWSQAGSSSTITFSISVVDGQIVSIGKTLGNCGCNPGDKPAGDPVNIGSGNLSEQFTDYTTAGQNPLTLIRYYNSFNETTTQIILLNGVQPFISSSALGGHWRTGYDRFLAQQSATVVNAERPDGRTLIFTLTGGVWATDSDVGITLTESDGTWTLTDTDDTVETYVRDRAAGGGVTLASIVSRGGYTQSLTYNPSGSLKTVTDTYGRTLKFSYTGGFLSSVVTPDSTTITYSYGISGVDGTTPDRLAGVTYPTSPTTSETYSYSAGQYSYQLTGITDEDGNLFASWTYDGSNRVLTSQHANGADLNTITYDDANGSRTVTNALGEQETEQFTPSQNVLKISEIDRAATSTTAAASRLFTYDGNGYLAGATDWNSNLTTFTNDARGLPTHIVEASGTSVARTTNITWDKVFHEPDAVATQGITQSFTYNGSGSPTSRTDTASNLKRSWTYAWSDALLASVTGPRTDVTQTTSFTYGTHGQLAGITNALGQTTRISSSTVGGRPLTVIDPNNVKTTLTYDARQRLLTQTVVTKASNFTTSWSYDSAGNLTNMQLPDGSYLANAYDAAHRLTMTQNAIGDMIAYTLDALGDRTQDVVGRGSTATWQHADAFDALGRVTTDQGGAGQTTAISRDPNGNPLMITDPLSRVTTQTFDALNRVTKIVDPSKGNTSFAYDAHDRVTKVVAPNGAVTTYAYDGFGRVLTRASPDTGTTTYAYDLADNQTQSQDASGVVTSHAYDALNRLTGTAYPGDVSEDVALSYDQSGHGFGIGRLTSLTDAVGSLSLSYDERGNELRETRKSGSVTRATSYSYDAVSRIAGIGYPSGTVVAYGHNAAGEVTALTAQLPKATQATSIVSSATYEPFGPIAGFTYGNELAESRSYDAAYRLGTLTAGSVQALTYSYNAADDVTGIKDGVTTGNSQSLAYDVLDRLTGATGAYGTFKWSYDHAGNRLAQALGGSTTDYSSSLNPTCSAASRATGRPRRSRPAPPATRSRSRPPVAARPTLPSTRRSVSLRSQSAERKMAATPTTRSANGSLSRRAACTRCFFTTRTAGCWKRQARRAHSRPTLFT